MQRNVKLLFAALMVSTMAIGSAALADPEDHGCQVAYYDKYGQAVYICPI